MSIPFGLLLWHIFTGATIGLLVYFTGLIFLENYIKQRRLTNATN